MGNCVLRFVCLLQVLGIVIDHPPHPTRPQGDPSNASNAYQAADMVRLPTAYADPNGQGGELGRPR